jgi:hypothetical protein
LSLVSDFPGQNMELFNRCNVYITVWAKENLVISNPMTVEYMKHHTAPDSERRICDLTKKGEIASHSFARLHACTSTVGKVRTVCTVRTVRTVDRIYEQSHICAINGPTLIADMCN